MKDFFLSIYEALGLTGIIFLVDIHFNSYYSNNKYSTYERN